MTQYIVTLKTHDDLDNFYGDMEGSSGTENIPSRQCECSLRRNYSRNTHYDLTNEEASKLRNDSRVLAVETIDPHVEPVECGWTQTAKFEKSETSISSYDKNWSLFRSINGATESGWGSDGTPEITRTINTTSSGKNVDVVMVDRHMNFDHPEFAVNPDGSGGSRAKEFNWFQYSSALGYTTPATYDYFGTPTSGTDHNLTNPHGTHTAGTACGNTQGWARDANIYNMTFAGDAGGGNSLTNWTYIMFDYIRYFHNNKPINPETGRRNPTICNNSWGYNSSVRDPSGIFRSWMYVSPISSITYRGTTTSVTGTNPERRAIIESNGIPVYYNVAIKNIPYRATAIDADIADCISDGIIMVAASGNMGLPISRNGDADYNNKVVYVDPIAGSSSDYYFYRGSTPGSTDNVISVGAVDSIIAEYKTDFSNYDKRVDVWAAGQAVISAVGASKDPYATQAVYSPSAIDLRNNESTNYYKLSSTQGTSMSSPQVCGYLACLLEQEPNLTPAEALQHLIEISKNNVGDASASNPHTYPFQTLGDSHNRWLFYQKKRTDDGVAYPPTNKKNRNPTANGVKYPRSSSLVTKTS